jgi:hypothetical protein
LTPEEKKAAADAMKEALEEYDKAKDDVEALETVVEMGKAADKGDSKKLEELAKKARQKGWTK